MPTQSRPPTRSRQGTALALGRAGGSPRLNWPPSVRIFLGVGPTDMRKGFESLASVVEASMALDPFSRHLFVFRSRRGDRIKVLYLDTDGYVLWYKRLENGCYRFPTGAATQGATHVEVKAADLMMILEGNDPSSARRQQRYERQPA